MKTVLITGACRGLGLALAKIFSEHSWLVLAACRDTDGIPPELSGHPNITLLSLDLSDQASLDATLAKVGGASIDVLINNAGIYDSSSVDDDSVVATVQDAEKVFVVNSIAPRLLADALAPNLEAGGEKLVITISSGMGTFAQLNGYGLTTESRGRDDYAAKHWVYSASKTAVNYAMLSYAVEHPTLKSVLINPGWMQTRIGGASAPFTPEQSAEAIFKLISDHTHLLRTETLVDTTGKVMEL